jgi:hypothetical protein
MSRSTYFRPNIHQNGPEILGVNTITGIENTTAQKPTTRTTKQKWSAMVVIEVFPVQVDV